MRPDTKIAEVAARMVADRISGLPVVDDDGRLMGIVTEGDLLRRFETGTEKPHSGWLDLLLGPGRLADDYVRSHSRTVRDVMTETVVTVTEDTPLADIVKLIERRHIKRVPVVRGDALVGLVSRADIVRLLAETLKKEQPPQNVSDTAIETALVAELTQAKWANSHNVTVAVRDGVGDAGRGDFQRGHSAGVAGGGGEHAGLQGGRGSHGVG
ncbi:MAG: CBS domain-containing protein [Rhodospirillales bacterium]